MNRKTKIKKKTTNKPKQSKKADNKSATTVDQPKKVKQFNKPIKPQYTNTIPHIDVSNIETNIELKKLYKLDTTTKQRAADELTKIFTQCSDSNELYQYVTSYCIAYNYLAQHADRRVRELLYSPLSALFHNKVLRDKHLIVDTVFINWYLHCYDTSNEVKRIANDLFNKIFTTQQQRIDILIQQHNAYIERLTQILNSVSTNSDSDDSSDVSNTDSKTETSAHSRQPSVSRSPSRTSINDDESNDTRLTIGGTLSLASYIATLDTETNAKYSKDYESLLFNNDSSAVSHLYNNTNAAIRSAAYTLTQTLISKLQSIITAHVTILTPLVMQSIDDTDRNNQNSVWQIIISYVKLNPPAWLYITDSDNMFVDSLLQCIKTSGHGLGNSMYLLYLPFIASIPHDIATYTTTDNTTHSNLYYDILNAIWQSKSIRQNIKSDIVQSQTIDYTPLYTAYFECIQYICISYRNKDPQITHHILSNILLPLLFDQFKYSNSDASFFKLFGNAFVKVHYRLNDADTSMITRTQYWQQITDAAVNTFATNPRHSCTLYKSIAQQYKTQNKPNINDASHIVQSCNAVFLAAYRTFVKSNNNDALTLCLELANSFGLSQLLQYSTNESDKAVQFTQSQLIPTLTRLSSVNAQTANSVIKLIASSLDNMNATDKQQCIDLIVQQIQPRKKASMSTVLSVTHSILLQHMTTCNAVYDDVVLEHAETFLQAINDDDGELLQEYADYYIALLQHPQIVSTSVLTTLISSFYDVIGYWLELDGIWSDSLLDVSDKADKFMTHTGASTDCIPYVLQVLTTLISNNNSELNELVRSDTELQQLQTQIAAAIFWLLNSTHTTLAQQATQSMKLIDKQLIVSNNITTTLANTLSTVFDTATVTTLSNPTFQDKYVNCVMQLVQMYDGEQQHTVLTQLLPQHDSIVALLLQNTADSVSKLLCIHDSILALTTKLTAATLFEPHNDSATAIRAQLILDLIAIHYHTTYFINITHYNDITINAATYFTQAWKAVHLGLSVDLLQLVVDAAIQSSITVGWMYSRVLSDILILADYHAVEYRKQLQSKLFQPLSDQSTFINNLSIPLQHTMHALISLPASDWLIDHDTFNKSTTSIVSNIQHTLPTMLLDDSTKTQSAGMLSVLATIITSTATSDIGIADAPEWLLSDHTYLLKQCNLSDDILHSQHSDTEAFLRARIRLLDATLKLSGELDDETVDTNNVSFTYLVQWSTAAILYAVHTHLPSHINTAIPSRDFMYLEPVITVLSKYKHHVKTTINRSQCTQLFQALLQMFVSDITHTMNVQRYHSLLSNTANTLISLCSTPTAAQSIAETLNETSDGNKSNVSVLLQSLCHPHNSIAAAAQTILSYGIFYNAAKAKLTETDPSSLLSTHDSAMTNMSDTEVVQYRINQQRTAQYKQLHQLLPSEIVTILESKLAVQNVYDNTVQFARHNRRHKQSSTPFNNNNTSIFATYPAALQLRAHLLVWSIWLQILEISMIVERDVNDTSYSSSVDLATNKETLSLTYDKKVVLLSHIRDNDIEQAIIDELIEHVIVGNTEQQLQSVDTDTLTADMLQPTIPFTHTYTTALTKRLNALHRHDDESIDDTMFYGRLGAYLYMHTLRQIPAITRIWWQSVDRGSINELSRITATYFTPLLVRTEMNRLNQLQSDDDEFTVKCNYDSSVVKATYSHSEINILLTLQFASNYPLQPITVQLDDKLNIKDNKSKKWQLNIASILASQDGTILDAIKVWKRNIEKHFAGIEECPICYNIVSTQNHALPQVECNQCHNMFHSACLYKWFNSSGKSQCPMCRNLM